MKKLFFVICLSLAISGCATLTMSTKEKIQVLTDDQIYSRYTSSLCGGYGGRSMVSEKEKTLLRQEIIRRHPEWPEDIKRVVLEGNIQIGMTKEQLLASWGDPDNINRSVGSWGVHEQWIYAASYYKQIYVYVENGILTSWQN